MVSQSSDTHNSASSYSHSSNITTSDVETHSFEYNPAEFSLDHTLASGQCFRWKRRADGWWIGVVGRSVIGVRQEGDRFYWWTYPGWNSEEGRHGDLPLLRDYFQLDTDLGEIVRRIKEADPAAGEA